MTLISANTIAFSLIGKDRPLLLIHHPQKIKIDYFQQNQLWALFFYLLPLRPKLGPTGAFICPLDH
jgi:hypothetical protein